MCEKVEKKHKQSQKKSYIDCVWCDEIRRKQKECGINNSQIALKLNITREHYSRVVNGKLSITEKMKADIERLLTDFELVTVDRSFIWHEEIRKKQKECNVKGSQIATELGVTREHYSRIVNGKVPVSQDVKEKIEKAIEIFRPKEKELSLLIDYMRVRFPRDDNITLDVICENVLGIPFGAFEHAAHGWNNYEIMYVYGNIMICMSYNEIYGILIELRGMGCREYEIYLENNEQTWLDFFERVNRYSGVYKRLDLAINDHDGILNVGYLTNKSINAESVTKFRKWSTCKSGEHKQEKSEMGETLYLGTRRSAIYFCIYEKDYEQQEKLGIPISEADTKNRFELRLANERAEKAVDELLERKHEVGFMHNVVFGIVNQYITFLKADKHRKKTMWEWDNMWLEFVNGHNGKLRLTTDPQPFSERRTLNWLSHQCMPCVKAFIEKDRKRGTNIVEEMINNATPTKKIQKVLEVEEELFKAVTLKIKERGKIELY